MDIDSGINSFSREKKGMSPLIATVLLIAFAVALGAMIMNWSSSLGERGGPDCSTVTMIINPYLCYAENMIRMSIRNTGDPIEAITMRVIDKDIENEIQIKDSKLASGSVLQKEIPFVKTSPTYVALIPSIKYKDEVVPCPEPTIEISDLPNC